MPIRILCVVRKASDHFSPSYIIKLDSPTTPKMSSSNFSLRMPHDGSEPEHLATYQYTRNLKRDRDRFVLNRCVLYHIEYRV